MAATAIIDMRDYQAQNQTTNAAQTIISNGTYTDGTGVSHCVYPPDYTRWHDMHHHHWYPWPTQSVEAGVGSGPAGREKPHETVQRAMQEIATAARELARSAKEIGVPVDQRALEEALIAKLREAL